MLEDREQIAHQPKSDEPSGQDWWRVGKKRANEKFVPKAKPGMISTGKSSKDNASVAATDCCFAASACAAIDVARVPEEMPHVSEMSICVSVVIQSSASSDPAWRESQVQGVWQVFTANHQSSLWGLTAEQMVRLDGAQDFNVVRSPCDVKNVETRDDVFIDNFMDWAKNKRRDSGDDFTHIGEVNLTKFRRGPKQVRNKN